MKNGNIKTESFDMCLSAKEKQGFRKAADIAGLPLSAWIRERLRCIAARELQDAGKPIPFIENI